MDNFKDKLNNFNNLKLSEEEKKNIAYKQLFSTSTIFINYFLIKKYLIPKCQTKISLLGKYPKLISLFSSFYISIMIDYALKINVIK